MKISFEFRDEFQSLALHSTFGVKVERSDFLREKSGVNFLMDLPPGLLVEFLKQFSTRKKWCVKFLTSREVSKNDISLKDFRLSETVAVYY